MTEATASATRSALLPRSVSAPASARLIATTFLGPNEHSEAIVLLVSELVTNVVVHTNSDVELSLSQFDSHVLVEVSDPGGGTVKLRGADEVGGRGLQLVEALAQRWGITTQQDGKTVWFEVAASN